MNSQTHFRAHSVKQGDLIFSETELTIAGTGTQWGKSLAGSKWMYRKIQEFDSPESTYLLMAPTYKIMQQSMLPYFLKEMEGLGKFSKSDQVFEFWDKRKVYCRTETDPDSIVGIPNLKAYWLDEAGKASLYFHENIQARAASVGAKGLYTTSPYSRNWLYRDYIKPLEKGGSNPAITLIQAASWENPYHTLYDEPARRKMRSQMDERRFQMLFGGEWGKQAGLVYDCFDEDQNICEPEKLPPGTRYFAGVDWGHTEAFVIVVRAITPDQRHFQVSEFYKTGMTVIEQLKVARQKKETYHIEQFYCGHERPENILLFNQHGIPSMGVPEKDIQVGTDLHYELIKTRRYQIFQDSSPYSLDEYETYHYPEPEDLKADDDSKDQLPVGQNDHCMSANRFVTLKTYRTGQTFLPYVPEGAEGQGLKAETQEQRLKRLMRPQRPQGLRRTENW